MKAGSIRATRLRLPGEALPAWKLQAAGLVIAGFAMNLFGPRWWAGRSGRGWVVRRLLVALALAPAR